MIILERLRKLSHKIRSLTPSDSIEQEREKEKTDTSYYLKRYRADVKKFEKDRKKAINDYENNRSARILAILGIQNLNAATTSTSTAVNKINQIRPISSGEIRQDDNDVESQKEKPKQSHLDYSNQEQQQLEKKAKLKEKFLEWSSYSTAHGIPNIFRLESHLLRAIWIVCFLASFAYCSYTIVNIIIVFLQYGVLINQQVLTQTPVDFPVVTVCNLNAFDKRHAQTYINYVLAVNNISYVNNISLINIPPDEVNTLIKASIIGNTNFTQQNIMNMGFSIDYMLLTCYFNNVPCNTTDFRWIYDFDYTNCWQFNSGYDQNGNPVPIRQVNEAGSDRALNLELFIGDDTTQSQYMLNSGARVVVHNQSVTPIIASEGIDIATGFKTNVAFTRSFLSRLGPPYSDCIKNTASPDSYGSAYYKAIFNTLNMTTYRQKAFILEQCLCIDGSLPNIYVADTSNKTVTVCQTLSKLNCVTNARVIYFSSESNSSTSSSTSSSSSSFSSLCAAQCPLECDSETIDITTSSSRYPTMYYQSYLSAHTDIISKFPSTVPPDLTKTTVYLSVFYDDISTTYTEEIPAITGVTVLGTIGGNLGLFIGASLLTFVEIVELLLEMLFIYFNIRI